MSVIAYLQKHFKILDPTHKAVRQCVSLCQRGKKTPIKNRKKQCWRTHDQNRRSNMKKVQISDLRSLETCGKVSGMFYSSLLNMWSTISSYFYKQTKHKKRKPDDVVCVVSPSISAFSPIAGNNTIAFIGSCFWKASPLK